MQVNELTRPATNPLTCCSTLEFQELTAWGLLDNSASLPLLLLLSRNSPTQAQSLQEMLHQLRALGTSDVNRTNTPP